MSGMVLSVAPNGADLVVDCLECDGQLVVSGGGRKGYPVMEALDAHAAVCTGGLLAQLVGLGVRAS